MRSLSVLTLALFLAACGANDDASSAPTDETPLGELSVSQEEGVASAVSNVFVTYEGRLEDGSVFSTGEHVMIPLAGMPPGFARGVTGMRAGETKTFEVSPEEGYGDNPPDGVPPGATLRYEVTLHEVL